MSIVRPIRQLTKSPLLPRTICRHLSSQEPTLSTPAVSPFAPRHLLSTADLSPAEITTIVDRALEIKSITKHGNTGNAGHALLAHKSVAMLFTKRSTRTRVSTESACAHLGANSMFLGKDDVQFRVNESLYDTSRVISSMVACLVARVDAHADVADLSKASTVPVINALSDLFHPLQALTDYMTIKESFTTTGTSGLKLAWVGDANNVLYDLLITCAKMGVSVNVATPANIDVDPEVLEIAREAGDASGIVIETGHDPQHAVKDANIVVTDTWISMGEEAQRESKMRQFEGYQVTNAMASGAHPEWKFMHCLPRHPEEVDDDVFYGPRSLVFEEAENRKWIMIAVLEFLLSATRQ